MASHRAAPHRAESCARSALGLGYDSKFSLPCGVLMAGYAAGFSGLESFSPTSLALSLSLSLSRARSIFPFARAVSLSSARKSRKGNRERGEERGTSRDTREEAREKERDGGRWKEKQVVRGSSVRETFDLVEIPLISSVPLRARVQAQ